ncbi:MAG: hypothetical protein ACI8TP_004199 [Acidimicrobiales bacterium]|jgi:hypothetical protein
MRYLSDEWLARADEALTDLPPLDDDVLVGFVVTDGPNGDRSYGLRLGSGSVGVEPGSGAAAVTLRLRWDLAVAVSQGRASAQRAFLDGELVLGGNVGLLLGHQRELKTIDDRLVSLRASTDY